MTDVHPRSESTGLSSSGIVEARSSIAIFTSREPIHVLLRCLRATIVACKGIDVIVDVLVNGNRALAEEMARHVESLGTPSTKCALRVWYIPLGDKAHAWNDYLKSIWSPSGVTFFIDGYVEPNADTFDALTRALTTAPAALAASGVPTAGRSARKLQEQMSRVGGIHGNLYALRGSTMGALKARGFRLPLGIYRTDPLLGAVIAFNLDPGKNEWEPARILVVPHATWRFEPLRYSRPRDWIAYLRRMLRQAQGILENRAIRRHLAVLRRAPEELPPTALGLVNQWVTEERSEAVSVFFRHPLSVWALRQMRKPRDWSTAMQPSLLIANSQSLRQSQRVRATRPGLEQAT